MAIRKNPLPNILAVSVQHERAVGMAGQMADLAQVPRNGVLGSLKSACARDAVKLAPMGDRPTSAPNKSWLSQMDTQSTLFHRLIQELPFPSHTNIRFVHPPGTVGRRPFPAVTLVELRRV